MRHFENSSIRHGGMPRQQADDERFCIGCAARQKQDAAALSQRVGVSAYRLKNYAAVMKPRHKHFKSIDRLAVDPGLHGFFVVRDPVFRNFTWVTLVFEHLNDPTVDLVARELNV